MMTIEEKAKAYDEALAIAKQVINNNCSEVEKLCLECVLPELKESEDERIRKGLVQHLKELRNWKVGTMSPIKVPAHYDAWITYLEKQNDANKEYWRGYREGKQEILDKYAEIEKQKEQKSTLVEKLRSISTPADENWFEIQKRWEKEDEQKPAEWSEEYREEDLRTRFAFYTYKDEDSVLYLSNVFVEETSRNKGFGTKILAAAEKVAETLGAIQIRLKVKQDSPANAWYRKHGYGYMAFEDGYDWLEKNLEYMKPIKSEWNEEDKKLCQKTIEWLEEKCFPYALDDNNPARDCIVWLKSLRPEPHWKPSEEQMKWLKDVIETVPMTCRQQISLESLYTDLQKNFSL